MRLAYRTTADGPALLLVHGGAERLAMHTPLAERIALAVSEQPNPLHGAILERLSELVGRPSVPVPVRPHTRRTC